MSVFNPFRRKLAALTVSAASVAAGFFGYEAMQNVQFARAEQQVQATREQLRGAEDLAIVFRQVGKVVEPSVVSIEVHKTIKNPHRMPFDRDMLRRFFPRDENGEPMLPEGFGDEEGGPMEEVGTGSGVIMDAGDGVAYVLTNNHVAGNASEMTVTLNDGRQITKAKVLGTDAKSDLAVVKIETDRVIPAKWGNSDELQKGDWIMAFGSPFGYVGSMTHGIVSALNRTNVGILGNQGYENFIQVDAPINPGNSGGPLVNLRGEVVGINTAIASRSGGFQGIGFAIPSNQAKLIYAQLKEKGKVVRGWLGVAIQDVSRNPEAIKERFGYTGTTGVLVEQTFAKTPATGKLEPGDIITEINGKAVDSTQQLRNQVAATAPNTDVKLKVWRDGKTMDITVKLGEQPEDLLASTGLNRGERGGTARGDRGVAEALGMKLQTLNDQLGQKFGIEDVKQGAVVIAVAPRSPAFRAGIAVGDVITQVNKHDVKDAQEASDLLGKSEKGKNITLYVVSKEGSRFVFVQNQPS